MLCNGNTSVSERHGISHYSCSVLPRLKAVVEDAGPIVVCLYFLICALPLQQDFALLILAGATVPITVFARPTGAAQISRIDLAIILFFCIQAVAILSSPEPLTSLRLSAPLLPAALVYYLISAHVRRIGSLRLVCLAVTVVALGLAAAVLFTALRSPWTSTYRWAAHMGSPMIVVPNDFTFHALAMPLSALFLVSRCSNVERILAGLSMTLSLAAITLLRSRISLLTAFASLTLFAAFKRPRLVFVSLASLLAIFVATDAVLGFALLGKFGRFDEGVTGRASLWSAAWAAFLDSPWKGQGAHTFVFENVRWVHNLYLEALAEQGVAGLLALMILLGYGLTYAWRVRHSDSEEIADLGGATFAALAGFCFAGLFELTFLRQWVSLLLFTLLGVVARISMTKCE